MSKEQNVIEAPAEVFYKKPNFKAAPSELEVYHDCDGESEKDLNLITSNMEDPTQFYEELRNIIETTQNLLMKFDAVINTRNNRKRGKRGCKSVNASDSEHSTSATKSIVLEIHLKQMPNNTALKLKSNRNANLYNSGEQIQSMGRIAFESHEVYSAQSMTQSDKPESCAGTCSKGPTEAYSAGEQQTQNLQISSLANSKNRPDISEQNLVQTPVSQYTKFPVKEIESEHSVTFFPSKSLESHEISVVRSTIVSVGATIIFQGKRLISMLSTYMGGYADLQGNASNLTINRKESTPKLNYKPAKSSQPPPYSTQPLFRTNGMAGPSDIQPTWFPTQPAPAMVFVFPTTDARQTTAYMPPWMHSEHETGHQSASQPWLRSKPPSYISIVPSIPKPYASGVQMNEMQTRAANDMCNEHCPWLQTNQQQQQLPMQKEVQNNKLPVTNSKPLENWYTPETTPRQSVEPRNWQKFPQDVMECDDTCPYKIKAVSETTLVPAEQSKISIGPEKPIPPPPPPSKESFVKKKCCGKSISQSKMLCEHITSKELLNEEKKNQYFDQDSKYCTCGLAEMESEGNIPKCTCEANGALDDDCRLPSCIETFGTCNCDCKQAPENLDKRCCNLAIDTTCICQDYYPVKKYKLALPQHKDLKLCIACRFDPSPLIDENGKVFCPGDCGCCLCPWQKRPTDSRQDMLLHEKVKVCKCRDRGTIFNIHPRESRCSNVVTFDLCPCREVAEAKFLELYNHEMWNIDEDLLEKYQGEPISIKDVIELKPMTKHKPRTYKRTKQTVNSAPK